MGKEYVVSGAQLECTLGVAPSSLTVLPVHRVKLTKKLKANIGDCKGFVNIAPFGACKICSPPKPCTPSCVMWMGGKTDLLLDGLPALLNTDKVVCMAGGGMISIKDSGQGGADKGNDATQLETLDIPVEKTEGAEKTPCEVYTK